MKILQDFKKLQAQFSS